ncbi:hypothetical protein BDW69DRAFT_162347 [Aspergillus filifer]
MKCTHDKPPMINDVEATRQLNIMRSYRAVPLQAKPKLKSQSSRSPRRLTVTVGLLHSASIPRPWAPVRQGSPLVRYLEPRQCRDEAPGKQWQWQVAPLPSRSCPRDKGIARIERSISGQLPR